MRDCVWLNTEFHCSDGSGTVHHIRERISVNGNPMTTSEVAALIRKHELAVAAAEKEIGAPPSHFEVKKTSRD